MKQDIDFKVFPVGMGPRGRKIVICPVCGQSGEFALYTSRESIYIHTARAEDGWLVVREKCMLPA